MIARRFWHQLTAQVKTGLEVCSVCIICVRVGWTNTRQNKLARLLARIAYAHTNDHGNSWWLLGTKKCWSFRLTHCIIKFA